MSTTVLCYGVMVKLKGAPIEEHLRNVINDTQDVHGFQINYDGTLAYIDVNAAGGKTYSQREDVYKVLMFGGASKSKHMQTYATMCRILNECHLEADMFSAKWFSCCWHNGSDSPLNEMTVANFDDPNFGT